jgi:LMBR1 domain-containing protein 1
MNRKYDQLLEKIQMMDNHLSIEERRYKYSNDYLMPYLYFFKYMARRDDESASSSRLKVWLPDTIVVNDRDLPAMWMYTSTEGLVFRTDSFTSKSVSTKFTENF